MDACILVAPWKMTVGSLLGPDQSEVPKHWQPESGSSVQSSALTKNNLCLRWQWSATSWSQILILMLIIIVSESLMEHNMALEVWEWIFLCDQELWLLRRHMSILPPFQQKVIDSSWWHRHYFLTGWERETTNGTPLSWKAVTSLRLNFSSFQMIVHPSQHKTKGKLSPSLKKRGEY